MVGKTASGEEALEPCRYPHPDVPVFNPRLDHPGGSVGWSSLATKLMRRTRPPRILLFGDGMEMPAGEDAEGLLAASGADGFVDARAQLSTLARALGKIPAGERVLHVYPQTG